MLKRLLLAALIALVVGPAYSFHHLGRIALPSAATAPGLALGSVVSVDLEPLLPSGRF
jgi:hypothetical protein